MHTRVAARTIEAAVARSDSPHDVESDSPPNVESDSPPNRSPETDADKVWRQRLIRRKTTLARRALAAHRRR
jgi:hypothetical protein